MSRFRVLLFDGTWSHRRDRSHIARLAELFEQTAGSSQVSVWYDPGVGTSWYSRLTGGLFGWGLTRNILQGYRHLAESWVEHEEIALFGYSRGAYTARSLVGMLRKSGLMREPSEKSLEDAYRLYRNQEIAPDDREARAFRERWSREVRIAFLGVFDTVGALGIPAPHVPFGRSYYRWHDTELSKIVRRAYHAVALDETRPDYAPTLWAAKEKPEQEEVEQRWFVGVHGTIGGGYGDGDGLSLYSLGWMTERIRRAGLPVREPPRPSPEDLRRPLPDPFAGAIWKSYRLVRGAQPRVFGHGHREVVDPSVWERWRQDPSYRPAPLRDHPGRPI